MNGAAMGNFEVSHRRAWRTALKKPQHDMMNRAARVESLVRQSITADEILIDVTFLGNDEKAAPV
jgi:hypothetical protein